MMTHRALVHEYVSCDRRARTCSADDRPLHSMPLYHSAQMHVFLLPYLAVGADEPPDGGAGRRGDPATGRGGRGSTRCSSRPTVWVAAVEPPRLRHPRPVGAAQGLLRRVDHAGAGARPAARAAARSSASTTASGSREIGPLATVLRPEEHDERPDSVRAPGAVRRDRGWSTSDGDDVPPGELGEVVYRSPQLCEGYWDKPEETEEAFRDGWFHSGDLVRMRRRRATSPSSTASRT